MFSRCERGMFFRGCRGVVSFHLFCGVACSFEVNVCFPFPFTYFHSCGGPFMALFSNYFPVERITRGVVISPSSKVVEQLVSVL